MEATLVTSRRRLSRTSGAVVVLFLHLNLRLSTSAGEDQHWRRHARTHDARLPEQPGPGGGRRHPGGSTEELALRLHRQQPGRSQDCTSGGEPLESESSSNLVIKRVRDASSWSVFHFLIY